jgi:predicted SprT family Zn-dependent metalloprotease
VEDLQVLWERLNRRFFEGTLPPCRIEWSRRLTRAAGNIDVRKRRVKLSVPLLIDAFENNSAHQVLGVRCEDSASAVEEVLKHEAIHLWLFERGLPHGHTPQFRQKAREIGQPRTRHAIARPLPRTGWVYTCAGCGAQIVRRKRFAAARACARCCRTFSNGKFDARFKLSARRITVDKGS